MKAQVNGYRSIAGYYLAGLLVSLGLGVVSAGSAAAAAYAATDGTSYTEDLTVQRLGQHHVGARFVFRSHWVPQARHRCQEHEDWHEGGEAVGSSGSSVEIEGAGKLCHFDAVFPRAVGVLLDKFKVRDLSLQVSKGKWDTTAWGNGPSDGASGEYTPGGAEMWARLPVDGAWESWVGLRRSLSGLYCSSLDGMDKTRVHTPKKMPMPGESSQIFNDTTVLRGALPREPVCTENLIPLIKMLPCRSKTGLGRLLHPPRIFQSDYHSISVRASATFADNVDNNTNTTRSPEDTAGGNVITSLTLEQTVLAVFRPRPHLPSASSTKSEGLEKGNANRARRYKKHVEVEIIPEGEGWSMLSLLLPLKSASGTVPAEMLQLGGCPIATRSAIHVVEGSVSGGGIAPSAAATATANGNIHSDKPTSVATRLLEPLTAEGEKMFKSDEPTSGSSSISDYLQKKLWDVVDDIDEAELPGDTASGPATAYEDETAKEQVSAGVGAAAVSPNVPAVARLDHYLSGRGGTRGVSTANLVNMHPTSGSYVDFLQPVPYFMVPLFGTLRARLAPSCSPSSLSSVDSPTVAHSNSRQETSPPMVLGDSAFTGQVCRDGGDGEEGLTGPLVSLVQNATLTPGEGRRPAVIEARLWVPAASTLVLGFDFFKRFLTVDDFPPDPSRGFDVPPPLARFSFAEEEADAAAEIDGSFGRAVCKGVEHGDQGQGLQQKGDAPNSCAAAERERGGLPKERREEGRVVYAYGDAGLLDTPQPDFSMPFNVITFTSTVITFFLGTVINLLVRKSRKRVKKANSQEPSKECSDKSGSSGARVQGEVGSWFDRPRRVFAATFGLLRKRGGESVAGRRINGQGDAVGGTGQ